MAHVSLLFWGVLVCTSAVALTGWACLGTMRITCTKQGITTSRRRLLGGGRQRNYRWCYVTATTYTYGEYAGHGTFAVETSEGTAVRINHGWFTPLRNTRGTAVRIDEFVAICNARTPHLPYIWVRPPRCPPDYIRVQRDQGGP